VLRAGGRIHTQSPALRLGRRTGAWSIDTPQGSVTAPVVIIATNAYTDSISEELRRTMVPVPSFQVATAPIPAELRATILPEGQAASDTWHLLRYFRLDASGRLVLGSRGTFSQAPQLRDVHYHYRAVHDRACSPVSVTTAVASPWRPSWDGCWRVARSVHRPLSSVSQSHRFSRCHSMP